MGIKNSRVEIVIAIQGARRRQYVGMNQRIEGIWPDPDIRKEKEA
jgi:hypothetical protein